ncbi:MAG: 2-C-methyl-D-erythritol 4-phosphate cytidylyltransferase [Lachnospiraceae bacterium]
MNSAIVLSAGKGTRMQSDVAKQYMLLGEHPVLYYALKSFEDSIIDEIIIVAASSDIDYVKKEIVQHYALKKVKAVVAGGSYRFESVYNGLKAVSKDSDYVFIHDGARPFVTPEMIAELSESVKERDAVVAACPVKDTIKVVDEGGKVESTPKRSKLWQVQTPQVFAYNLINYAYTELIRAGDITATDDAMVVETYGNHPVYLTDTGYLNIKITTPEDMVIAEALLHSV